MAERVSLPELKAMKRAGQKVVGVVVWDFQMASIVDRVGVEIVSVGDTVGVNLWGHDNPLTVTLEEMLIVARAARRGTQRALLSCDFPYGPLQEGTETAVRAAIRLVKEAGVDLVKLDAAAEFPDTVAAMTRAGIPVWAQFGLTPQTAMQHGIPYRAQSDPGAEISPALQQHFVQQARALEAAGAALLDFTNSGPTVGAAVAASVSIPVLGGFGGGPWLDGRIRMAHAAIGYGVKFLDHALDSYANVAQIAFDALSDYAADVRAARQIKGAKPAAR